MRFTRSKHLLIWGGLIVAVVVVLSYGVARAVKHKVNDGEVASPRESVIDPKFKLNPQ